MSGGTSYKTILQFTVDGLQDIKGAAKDIKGVEAALNDIQRRAGVRSASAYDTLGLRSLKDVQAEITRVRASLSTLRTAGAGPAELARASAAARDKLAALNAELRGTNAASANADAGLGGVAKRLGGIVAAALSARAAIEGVKAIVDSGLNLEKQQSLFNLGSGGDTQKAAQDLAFARSESDRLGLSLKVTAEQYAKLTAGTVGTNLAGQSEAIFSGIAEYATVARLSAEEFNGVMVAVNQVINKGTLSSEELKQQIGERLPGAFKLAAEAMGVTREELTKLLDEGAVSSYEFLPKFAEALRGAAANGLVEATNSTQAQLNRLANAFEEFKQQIAAAGVFDALIAEITLMLEKLGEMADSGELQEIAQGIADIVSTAVEFFGQATRAAITFREEIGTLLVAVAGLTGFNAIAKGIAALVGPMTAAGAAAGSAATGINAMALAAKRFLPLAIALAAVELADWMIDLIKAGMASGKAIDDWKTAVEKLATANAEFQGEYRKNAAELAALSDKEFAAYQKRIAGAKAFNEARRALAIYDGQTEQAEIHDREFRAYEKHTDDIKRELERRGEVERQLATNTAAVRRGMLSELEAALAAEKKALQAANADLQRASNERKSIAEKFRQLVVDLGTPKVGGGGELSLGDASAAVLRAEAASAQAANLTGDAAQRKAQEAKRLADEAKKTLEQLAQEDAQRETQKYNAGDFKYLAERLERAANKAAVVDQDVAQAKAAEAEAKLKTLEARIAALGEPIKLQLETDPNNLTAIRQAIEEKLRGITVQVTPAVGDAAASADIPKRAYGGPLPGYSPHDRADNLLFMGTAGEWVLDRPTRRYYGDAFLRQLMQKKIPRFAYGGPLDGLSMPRLSEAAIAPAPALQPINLTLPGVGTFPVQTTQDVATAMQRQLYITALQEGR